MLREAFLNLRNVSSARTLDPEKRGLMTKGPASSQIGEQTEPWEVAWKVHSVGKECLRWAETDKVHEQSGIL